MRTSENPLVIRIFDEQGCLLLSGDCKSVQMTADGEMNYVLRRLRSEFFEFPDPVPLTWV